MVSCTIWDLSESMHQAFPRCSRSDWVCAYFRCAPSVSLIECAWVARSIRLSLLVGFANKRLQLADHEPVACFFCKLKYCYTQLMAKIPLFCNYIYLSAFNPHARESCVLSYQTTCVYARFERSSDRPSSLQNRIQIVTATLLFYLNERKSKPHRDRRSPPA